MARTAADFMAEALQKAGVKRVYGVVGDSLNGFTDALRRRKSIDWIHVRHEEAAAFAAGAEAHLTGELAVCAGSCGPGNLHLINGLFDCHRSRVPDALEVLNQDSAEDLIVPFREQFEPLPGLRVRALPLAHDRAGSHGFVFQGFGRRVGYATDLGRVPPELIDHFTGLDLLALESNYDPQMQLSSARPWFLKRRIMDGRGHLSNEQAYEAICRILDRAQRRRGGGKLPHRIVLLHRSRECNCPKLLRKLFEQDQRIASRLTLAEQFERSEWLCLRPTSPPLVGEQLALGFTP